MAISAYIGIPGQEKVMKPFAMSLFLHLPAAGEL